MVSKRESGSQGAFYAPLTACLYAPVTPLGRSRYVVHVHVYVLTHVDDTGEAVGVPCD